MSPDATPTDAEEERTADTERVLGRETDALALFASVVSHDLSNPLELGRVRRNAAQQTLSALRSDLDDADVDVESDLDSLETHLEKIATAQDRMRELLTDARSLTEHGPDTDPAPVSLAETARTAWGALATAGATLDVEADGEVTADESQFQQLFENLYRNALDHADAGATIRVGTLPEAAGFYIADDGPGIPAGDRENVFELGYTTAENGTGFGLAIVAEIAKRHEWSIDVTESERGGARFEVVTDT